MHCAYLLSWSRHKKLDSGGRFIHQRLNITYMGDRHIIDLQREIAQRLNDPEKSTWIIQTTTNYSYFFAGGHITTMPFANKIFSLLEFFVSLVASH